MAFVHARLLAASVDFLRSRVRATPILLGLLPELFTLAELQSLTEATLGEDMDVRNFRRRLLDAGWVVLTSKFRREGGPPAGPALSCETGPVITGPEVLRPSAGATCNRVPTPDGSWPARVAG